MVTTNGNHSGKAAKKTGMFPIDWSAVAKKSRVTRLLAGLLLPLGLYGGGMAAKNWSLNKVATAS